MLYREIIDAGYNMIGELLDALVIGRMPSRSTIEKAAAWAKLEERKAKEAEQTKILQQMYFYETPRPVSVCSGCRAISVDTRHCHEYLDSSDLSSFTFNAFEATERLGKRALTHLTMYCICSMNLVEALNLSFPKLQRFLDHVEQGYRDVPYHNKVHVIDVVQRFHAISLHLQLSQRERLAGYIAAAIHDYGHGGVTNSYLIATGNVIARRYNDRSPWENFHVSQTLELMRNENNAFVPNRFMGPFKSLVIHLVLATDMSCHVEVLRPGAQHRLLTLALKCADVGHCSAPTPLHRRWSEALMNELKLQGKLEQAAGLPETWVTVEESQAKFFDLIITPMFEMLHTAAETTHPLLAQIIVNRTLYN